jgi:hypothetical protein
VKITLRHLCGLGFLRGERRVRVRIERFRDSGELALPAPRGRRPALVPIEHGEAALTLHGVRRHEAYRLKLSAP